MDNQLLLLREYTDFQDLEILKEEDESSKKKRTKIKGVMLMTEQKNKNGRTYSKKIISEQVEKFNKEKIDRRMALGAADHPSTATLELSNAAIHTDELYMDGNDAIGKATILSTPSGKILECIIDDGYSIGVSSRGVGKLDKDKNVTKYHLITIDAVADPSGQKCMMESIYENREYIIGDDGEIYEAFSELKTKLDDKYNSKVVLNYLKEFLEKFKL